MLHSQLARAQEDLCAGAEPGVGYVSFSSLSSVSLLVHVRFMPCLSLSPSISSGFLSLLVLLFVLIFSLYLYVCVGGGVCVCVCVYVCAVRGV